MKDYDDNGVLRSWGQEDVTVPVHTPTLAEKVINSVNQRARQYGGKIHGEDGLDMDVEFPTLKEAADFVSRCHLDAVACLRSSHMEFNTPVTITFTLTSYARIAGIEA